MLVCIPTNGNAGLNETLSDHFGSAAYFTLYDSDSGEIQLVKNRNASHAHGTCHPMTQLARYHVDSIICSGIGRRAIEMLKNDGVTVYQSDKKTVAEVVEQINKKELSEVDPATACKGHGQRQGTIGGSAASGDSGSGRGRGIGMNRKGQKN
jgi:predicted Fe-Mo cluster-binding NifX family protein